MDMNSDDISIIKQHLLDIRFRFEIFDKNDIYIDEITGSVVNGNGSIDAESDIRRTFTVNVHPDRRSRIMID